MDNFPPKAYYEREVNAVIEFLASVIKHKEGIYMSAPITSGKRRIELIKANGFYSNQNDKIIEISQIADENRSHAKMVSQKLRESIDGVIIDPTLVADIDGWAQDDYRDLWRRVIERFIKTAVFIDDWNYSNGCSFEFLVSKKSGVKTLDEQLVPLNLNRGIQLIENSITDLRDCKISTEFLESVVLELKNLK